MGITLVTLFAMMFVLNALESRASERGEAEASAKPAKTEWAIVTAFHEFEAKLQRAANVDRDNEELRKQLAKAQAENDRLLDESLQCQEQARSEMIKAEAVAEGGHEAARTIASLPLSDEGLLSKPPKAIFEDASEQFEEGHYETAGRAFAFLVDNSENDAFQDAQTYYLAGVSLYKVGNYKRAITYLQKSEQLAVKENLSYAPRALGWIVLCHKKLGDAKAEHGAARELIQKFPKSREARRLNRNA